MDPISAGSASNPINNPRLDLLHSSGTNEQLKGIAGSYGPASGGAEAPKPAPATPPPAVPAAPAAYPAPAPTGGAPKSAASYVAAAQSKRPTTSSPIQPQPIPEPRLAPQPQGPAAAAVTSNGGGAFRMIAIIIVVLLVIGGIGFGAYTYLGKSKSKTAATPTPAQSNTQSNAQTGTGNTATDTTVAPVAPNNLAQAADGGSALADGATTASDKVTFTFTMPTTATSGSVTPQIEVRPAGTAFTGEPTTTGNAIDATGDNISATVTATSIAAGAYHWQARFSANGTNGDWTAFGSGSGANFTVAAAEAAPAATAPSAAASTPATNAPAASTPAASASASAAPGASTATELAPTGDPTSTTSLTCLAVMLLAAGGWIAVRRYART